MVYLIDSIHVVSIWCLILASEFGTFHVSCSMCIFVVVKLIKNCSWSMFFFLCFSALCVPIFSQYLLYADTSWVVLLRWHNFSIRFDFRSFVRSFVQLSVITIFWLLLFFRLFCCFLAHIVESVNFQFSHNFISICTPDEECTNINNHRMSVPMFGVCVCVWLNECHCAFVHQLLNIFNSICQ